MRVWITRAQPGADATAQRLRALGHDPLVAPVLEVRSLDVPVPDLRGVAALAFTSANGVRALAGISAERATPVFTVGDATARAARAAGFGQVRSAGGEVADLVRLIADHAAAGEVLHLRGRDVAGDLAGDLTRCGVPARQAILYETWPTARLPRELRAGLETLDAVLVHSPKAARVLPHLLATAAGRRRLCGLTALGLSPACIAPLGGLGMLRLRAAAEPREDALLALLDP